MFLRVSGKHQRDISYFSKLCKAIGDPLAVGAFVDFLLNMDISRFNVRERPETREHTQQKLQSLDGFERYWYEVLLTSDFSGRDNSIDKWENAVFKPTSELLASYRQFDKQAERYRTAQESQVSEALRKLCPSATPKRKMHQPHGLGSKQQKRGFQLPDIQKARSDFEAYVRCRIDWGEGDSEEEAA